MAFEAMFGQAGVCTQLGENQPMNYFPASSGSRRIGLIPLVCMIYLTVCGGAFGLEALVGAMGPLAAVALIVMTPVLWSTPIAFMVAELSSSIPEAGGHHTWVRRALGDLAGMQSAWLLWAAAVVELSIYPNLCVSYSGYFLPSLNPGHATPASQLSRGIMSASFIGASFLLQARSIRSVGRNAVWTTATILGGFALFVVWGFAKPGSGRATLVALTHGPDIQGSLALGFAIVMWNFSGWEDNAAILGEVAEPRRTLPRALAIALPVITLTYLLPVLAGLSVTTSRDIWNEDQGWPVIAAMIGGPPLAALIAVMAIASTWALFNGHYTYSSRLLQGLAKDGWLPGFLARTGLRTGAPHFAVATIALVALFLSFIPFRELVVLGLLLYSSVLALEMTSLITLRVREPLLERPFRVPGKWLGLCFVVGSPMLYAMVVFRGTIESIKSVLIKSTEEGRAAIRFDLRRDAMLFVGIILTGLVLFAARLLNTRLHTSSSSSNSREL